MTDKNWWGFTVRAELTAPFLRGRGMEIGAGHSPQRLPPDATALYFDKRDASDLSARFETSIGYEVHPVETIGTHFPTGADFLIAHNVVEHCPDVIGALMSWQRHVRNGGVMVISAPIREHTAGDARRLEAPFRHLLEDYLFRRDGDSFDSRQHVYDFCMGWDDAKWSDAWRHMDRDAVIDFWLDNAHAPGHDFHWHALSAETWEKAAAAAALFAGRGASMLVNAGPDYQAPYTPQGEALLVYRMEARPRLYGFASFARDAAELLGDLERGQRPLREALANLARSAPNSTGR